VIQNRFDHIPGELLLRGSVGAPGRAGARAYAAARCLLFLALLTVLFAVLVGVAELVGLVQVVVDGLLVSQRPACLLHHGGRTPRPRRRPSRCARATSATTSRGLRAPPVGGGASPRSTPLLAEIRILRLLVLLGRQALPLDALPSRACAPASAPLTTRPAARARLVRVVVPLVVAVVLGGLTAPHRGAPAAHLQRAGQREAVHVIAQCLQDLQALLFVECARRERLRRLHSAHAIGAIGAEHRARRRRIHPSYAVCGGLFRKPHPRRGGQRAGGGSASRGGSGRRSVRAGERADALAQWQM
jgi:hypothetical protein